MFWLQLLDFWDFSIYNLLSKGFPKTGCDTVSNSLSSISGTFTQLCICIQDNFKLNSVVCCFILWNEMILISEESKTSQRK